MAKLAASCLLVLLVCCTANAGHFSQWYDDGRPGADANLEYHVMTTQRSWWEAVREGCGTGRVYIPKSDELPDAISQKLTSGQYYWMGAIAYSTWKWTDGSAFYNYVGYSTEPLSESDGHRIVGNSASRCHLKCEGSEPFGLRGDTCYCDVNDQVQMTRNQTEVRCPGNYDEKCGNKYGVSVYRNGEIAINQGNKGMCVYAEIRTGRRGWYTGLYSSRCDTLRSAACETGTVLNEFHSSTDSDDRCSGTVCVYHTLIPWDEANRTCNFVTVTNRNNDYLYDAMRYKPLVSEKKYTYWIGLRRGYVKKWLNGSDYLDSVPPYTVDKLCLSTTGTSLFRWEDCSKKLPTICESASPESTRSTTPSSLHTTLQSIDTGTSTTMTTTTTTPRTMSVLTSQASFTRVVIQKTTEPFSDKHDQGLYYGLSGLGVVTVAVVITLLLVMYKQKRCCFASAPVDPKANSLPLVSMDNDLYLCTMDVQTEQGAVLEPSATANRNCGDDDYDLLGQNKRGCTNEETGDAVFSYPKDSGPHNRPGHGTPVSHHDGRGAYDHVLKGQSIQDETYDHAGDNGTVRKGDDVYDHAGENGTVRKVDDVYDHADHGTVGKGDDVNDHAGDNGTVRKGDNVFDHAGENGTVCKVDDVYDHADHGTVRKGDDVYDHAGEDGTVRKGDDVYDHADHGTVRKGDDVYDNAGVNGTVSKGDDVYDHAGDNGTVRKGDDVYDHAGEDSCYYNMR